MRAGCLDDEQVSEVVRGALSPEVEQHLAGCAECAALVAFMVKARAPDVEPPTEPEPNRKRRAQRPTLGPGALVDRFIVLGAAGAGAMGAVYIAHDPTLDRKVALKLLHADHAGSDLARLRLQREAQALARLSCKNLVGVFDVLVWHEQLVVALEYVEGSNLRQWLNAQPRTWREVVHVFLEAGRGLAAAHAAGLVHRDFKPDNVLISTAGEVKVSDFGLVSTLATDEVPEPNETIPENELLTEPGTLLGTPAYMAPELFRGDVASVKTDQFAFCVALFEGLQGQRPFASVSMRNLVQVGGVRAIRAPTKAVPAWLRRLVLRGLEADPNARFPSLEVLLQELGRDRQRERARLGWGVVMGGALLFLAATLARRPPDPCGDGQLSLRSSWSPPTRAAIGRQLVEHGHPASAAAALDAELDDYLQRWEQHLEVACRPLERKPVPPSFTPYLACLHGAAGDFRGVVDALSNGDVEAVALSRHAVAALVPVTGCDGLVRNTPPRRASALERLRLAELRAAAAAGELERGLALGGRLLDPAHPVAPEFEARVQSVMARLEAARGRFDLALEHARQENLAAQAPPRDEYLLAQSWLELAELLARARGHDEAKLREAEHCLGLSRLAPGATEAPSLQGARAAAEAEIGLARREVRSAVRAAELGVQTARQGEGDVLRLAQAESCLGRALLAAGEPGRAAEVLEALLQRDGGRLPPWLAGNARVVLLTALTDSGADAAKVARHRAQAVTELEAAGAPAAPVLDQLTSSGR